VYFATGEIGRPLGSAHQSTAPYQAVRTSDGWVTLGAVTPKTWTGLCEALDLQHLLDDPRFQDAFERHGHRDTLIPAIEEASSRRTTAAVVEALDAAGVPCAPIADMGQVFNDEHLNQRDFYWDAPHPTLGSVRQIGSPLRMSATPAVRRSAGPLLGADTEAVLRESGIDEDTIQKLLERGVVVGVATDDPPTDHSVQTDLTAPVTATPPA
jgi:crotonobetainyl-CoA:carnitine CoA-transferase CaiB-like acyl-CoA transferase